MVRKLKNRAAEANSLNREALDDKGYNNIFKALFRFISIEKAQFTRLSSRKGQVTTRLAKCATVLRTTIEVSVRSIKFKTFIAVVRHITNVLSDPGSGLWEPLGGDYIKALRTALQYPPHVEHLSKNDWWDVVDFCLTSIGVAEKESSRRLSIRNIQRLGSETLGESRSRSASRDPASRQRSHHGIAADSIGSNEELELCLQFLTGWPASPVLDGTEKLLSGIAEYLAPLNPIKSAPHAAFGALNAVLARASTDSIDLVRTTVVTVIPTIRKFWVTKSAALKEEMLITLLIGKDALVSFGLSSPTESFNESLQELVEQLHRGYLRQPDKDTLQVEDVVFTSHSTALSMGTRSLYPRLGVARSMTNWAALYIIASLSKLLDSIGSSTHESRSSVESPSKRPRLQSKVEDIFRDASSSSGFTRTCALQLLPFLLFDSEPGVDQLSSLLHRLAPHILDESSIIASWTMIAISR